MELVTPGIGLFFWAAITFTVVLVLLRQFAWKPIMAAVKEREVNIEASLAQAEAARQQMAQLKNENEKLLQEARLERDRILKSAQEASVRMIDEARDKARSEGQRELEQAKAAIQNEKMAAITELKAQVALLSVEIAEQVLRRELADEAAQQQLVKEYLQEVQLN